MFSRAWMSFIVAPGLPRTFCISLLVALSMWMTLSESQPSTSMT